MDRRKLAWLLTTLFVCGGSALAHALAYALVYGDAHERGEHLASSGHGYFPAFSLVVGVALAATALWVMVEAAFRRRRESASAPPRLWAFAVAGPLLFTLQEHVERLVHEGAFPLDAALEPTFVVGLLLEILFALAAVVAAYALLRAADTVARARASVRSARRRPAVEGWIAHPVAPLRRRSLLAGRHAGRAPPASLTG